MPQDALADAQLAKAVADAAAAQVALEKARREEAEASSPSAARQRRAAARLDLQTKQREATSGTAELLSGAVPDLGSLAGSTTTVAGESPALSALLQARAVERASAHLVDEVKQHIRARPVLVTTSTDLATPVTTRDRVLDALSALEADLAVVSTPPQPEGGEPEGELESLPVLAIATAAAQLIPGLIGLGTTGTTVRSSQTTLDAAAAALQVSIAFAKSGRSEQVRHDGLHAPVGEARARLRAVRESFRALPDTEDEDWRARRDTFAEDLDTITTALTTPGDGARAPIDVADLYADLGTDSPTAPVVLLVQAGAVSVTDVLRDKKFGTDSIAVSATAVIPWALVTGARLAIATGGHAVGLSRYRFKVGEDLPSAVPNDLV